MKYILLISFIFNSCVRNDDYEKALSLVNDSSKDVYFYNSEDFSKGHFPDTLLPMEKPIGLQFVKMNGKSGKYVNPDWDFRYSIMPESKFTVFVLNANLVDSIPWIEIREDYEILARYDITLEELEESNYTIKYPPK